MEEITCILPKC